MSHPDFNCTIEDNHGILIVIHALPSPAAPPDQLKSVIESITRLRQISLENTPREIKFRYQFRISLKKDENADFQVHRQVFGLICFTVAEPSNDAEAEKRKILTQYNGYLAHYGEKLIESRCLVLRSKRKADVGDEKENYGDDTDGSCLSKDSRNKVSPAENGATNGFYHEILRPVQKSYSDNSLNYPVKGTAGTPPLPGVQIAKSYVEIPLDDLVERVVFVIMEEYLLALFSGLEARRPLSVPDKLEKDWKGSSSALEKADHTKKDGLRFDFGSSKKRQLGRKRRTYAEWLLLAGLPYQAIQNFAQAVEMLQSAKDTSNLAAASEGWAAASWYVLPASDPQLALRQSATEKPEQRLILTKAKAASLNGYLVNAFNLSPLDHPKDRKLCLNTDAIYDKLKYSAQNYSTADRGDLEMEVSLKLARLFTFLGESLKAHKGLRQATFVKLDSAVNEANERIERFLTIASLYENLGFLRQAALFRLLAADRFLSAQNTAQAILRAFHLSIKSLKAYNLTLSERPATGFGWPELQAQVFRKLAATCRSQPEVFKRISLIMLENFCDVLSAGEKDEILKNLTDFIDKYGPPRNDVVADGGISLEMVSLTKIPFVQEFLLMPLSRHLQPVQKVRYQRSISGLPVDWIYKAPRAASKNHSSVALEEASFLWVANEPTIVSIQLVNRLPRELRIENLHLLSENLQFNTTPVSLILPSMTGRPFPVMIAGVPLESGTISILGYSFSVFGINNQCLISDLGQFQKNPPPKMVKVTPALPQLRVETSLPLCDTFVDVKEEPVITTASILMYNGQETTCTVKLFNIGKVPLETISISVAAPDPSDEALAQRGVFCDSKPLSSKLPLLPGASAEIEINVWAALSFITAISQEKARTFQFFLRIDYSGGPGKIADFYRSASIAFFVDVLPSVGITQWNTLAGDEPDEFYFVLDFDNRTDEEVEVIYPPNKRMLIVGGDKARIPAVAMKVPLLDPRENNAVGICRDHLAEKVDLKWRFVDKEITGKCWIGDLTWNTDQMEMIALSPVAVEYSVIDVPVVSPRTEGCVAVLGVPWVLDIRLKNRFDSKIEGFAVGVELREERELPPADASVNGIAIIGGTTDALLNFDANQTITMQVEILMLIPGVFHLDIFFEHAHRRWKTGDSCVILVETNMNDGATG